MSSARRSCLGILLLAVFATPSRAQTKAASPQSVWGLQGSFGVGGGDRLGLAGFGTIGPRYRGNLFSLRGTVGQGTKDSLPDRSPIWEVGLTYGRRFCSPGACYSFAIGPGIASIPLPVTVMAPPDTVGGDSIPKAAWGRETTTGLMWQVAIQGKLGPTTSLGLTFVGNRNPRRNFWALMLGMQFGMPWSGGSSDDEE